jgi:outer membrane protein TolC
LRLAALLIIATAATPKPGWGDSPPVEISLSDAIYLGIRDNYTVRGAYLQRIADKFDLKVSEDKFTPQLALNSAYTRQRAAGIISSNASFGPSITWNTPSGAQVAFSASTAMSNTQGGAKGTDTGWTATVVQPLLRGGGSEVATASVRIAELSERRNKLTLKLTVEATVTTIIAAYRQLLQTREQLAIARTALGRAKDLVGINRSLIAAGRMAALDIVQTEADVANQELTVSQAADAVDVARLQLLVLLALDARSAVTPVDPLETKKLSVNVDRLLDIAFDNQEAYLQQLLAVEIDKINLMLAKNNRLWELDIVASASQGPGLPLPLPRQPDLSGGLQLTIPINDLTRPQGEVDTKVALDKDQLQLRQLHDQIEQLVRNDAREVVTQWDQLALAGRARELAQKQLDIEHDKLRAGRSSNFETLTYENQLESAQTNELAAKIAYLNALTTLDQQVGTTLDTWKIRLNDAP